MIECVELVQGQFGIGIFLFVLLIQQLQFDHDHTLAIRLDHAVRSGYRKFKIKVDQLRVVNLTKQVFKFGRILATFLGMDLPDLVANVRNVRCNTALTELFLDLLF